jgi:hypothetical protein
MKKFGIVACLIFAIPNVFPVQASALDPINVAATKACLRPDDLFSSSSADIYAAHSNFHNVSLGGSESKESCHPRLPGSMDELE